jgi:hypothetical protein
MFFHHRSAYLVFIAVYDDLRLAFDLLEIAGEEVPFVEAADDEGGAVDLIFCEGREGLETSVLDLILY